MILVYTRYDPAIRGFDGSTFSHDCPPNLAPPASRRSVHESIAEGVSAASPPRHDRSNGFRYVTDRSVTGA